MTLRGLSGLNEQNERSRQQATVRAAHLQHELIYLPCVGQSHTAATVQATAAARAAEREAEESRRAGMLPAEAFEAGLLPLQDALAQGGEQQRQLEEAVEVLRHELREAEAATARHAAALAGASASEVRQHARHHPFGIAAITSHFFRCPPPPDATEEELGSGRRCYVSGVRHRRGAGREAARALARRKATAPRKPCRRRDAGCTDFLKKLVTNRQSSKTYYFGGLRRQQDESSMRSHTDASGGSTELRPHGSVSHRRERN